MFFATPTQLEDCRPNMATIATHSGSVEPILIPATPKAKDEMRDEYPGANCRKKVTKCVSIARKQSARHSIGQAVVPSRLAELEAMARCRRR